MPVGDGADQLLACRHLATVALGVGELGERDGLDLRPDGRQTPEAHLLLERDPLAEVLLRLELEPDLAEPITRHACPRDERR
eukprot:3749847-Prymnesium_polylepis.1